MDPPFPELTRLISNIETRRGVNKARNEDSNRCSENDTQHFLFINAPDGSGQAESKATVRQGSR